MEIVAVLLTCYNRKQKTDECLSSLFRVLDRVNNYKFDIYLVDDNSKDGTTALIKEKYPVVKIINGTGDLFWAGGMRLAWRTALESTNNYLGFLLINDDVCFVPTFWDNILQTDKFANLTFEKSGIYVSSTRDKYMGQFTYGGHRYKNKLFKHVFYQLYPSNIPQECQIANANILYVTKDVVNKIGILDSHFTHSLADFDYTLTAYEKGIPVLVCPEFGGYCTNDHQLKTTAKSLKERIDDLYSIKGLALSEYLYYLNKHFWWKVPYAFIVHWMEAVFPNKCSRKNTTEFQNKI